MANTQAKQQWKAPKLTVFGSVSELTAGVPKFFGTQDDTFVVPLSA